MQIKSTKTSKFALGVLSVRVHAVWTQMPMLKHAAQVSTRLVKIPVAKIIIFAKMTEFAKRNYVIKVLNFS